MTLLLEQAVATVASLPDELQDEFAHILLQLVGHEQSVYVLTAEEEADLDASIAAEQRGDFATDEEMLPSGRSMPVENPLHRTRRPAARRDFGLYRGSLPGRRRQCPEPDRRGAIDRRRQPRIGQFLGWDSSPVARTAPHRCDFS